MLDLFPCGQGIIPHYSISECINSISQRWRFTLKKSCISRFAGSRRLRLSGKANFVMLKRRSHMLLVGRMNRRSIYGEGVRTLARFTFCKIAVISSTSAQSESELRSKTEVTFWTFKCLTYLASEGASFKGRWPIWCCWILQITASNSGSITIGPFLAQWCSGNRKAQ